MRLTAGSAGDGLILTAHWSAGSSDPEVEIVYAEPRAAFSAELLHRVARGEAFPYASLDKVAVGGTVKIRGRGRNLVYRLTEEQPADVYIGEWPD